MSMTPLRWIGLGVGIMGALALVAVLLVLSAPVQTWAVRRALDAQPHVTGEIARVKAGWGGVTLEGVELQTTAGALRARRVEVEWNGWAALRSRVAITRLVAQDWEFDPTRVLVATVPASVREETLPERRVATAGWWMAPSLPLAQAVPGALGAGAAGGVAPFEGVFALVELPVDLSLDGVDLAGRVVIPDQNGAAGGTATVKLAGGGVSAGAGGKFALTVDARLSDTTAPVRQIKLDGDLGVKLATPRTLAGLDVRVTMAAQGPQFPAGTMLAATVGATRQGDTGEMYRVRVEREGATLAEVKADYVTASRQLTGAWRIAAQDEDVAPFALGLALPDFNATGEGNFNVAQGGERLTLDGALQVRTSRLEVVMPELAPWGELVVATEFAVERRGARVQVMRWELQLDSASPVAAMRVLQPVEIDLATQRFAVPDAARDVVQLTLAGLRPDWLQGWLGDIMVSGEPLRGEWRAQIFDGGVVVKAAQPLRMTGIDVTRAGTPLARGLDISALISGLYAAQGWQVELESLGLRDAAQVIATLSAKTGQPAEPGAPLVAVGRYALNLAGALGQPALSGPLAVTAGQWQGEFSARVGELLAFMTKGTLRDVVTADGTVMPVVNFDARAESRADGAWEIELPLTVQAGERTTDLAVRGTVAPTSPGVRLALAVTGEKVFPADLQILAGVLGATAETAPPPPGDLPPWAGVEGAVTVQFKSIDYPGMMELQNVAGRIELTAEAVRIVEWSTGVATGGTVDLRGMLLAPTAAGEGYRLSGNLDGRDVDTGRLLRALDPARAPVLEGVLTFSGQMSGEAASLAGLGEAVMGELSFSSRGGVLRALSFDLGPAAQVGSGVVGLVAGFIGGEWAQGVAQMTQAAIGLSTTLSAIRFDQFSGKLERTATRDYRIANLALIAPTLRLTGGGGISYQPEVPVWRQPLSVELLIGARDATATQLQQLRMLGTTADSLGFTPLVRPVRIQGTLMQVGVDELKNQVIRQLGLP